MSRIRGRALCFTAGLATGLVVTKRLHNDPESGIWGQRIAETRLRYANLPVGGTIALVLSALLPERLAGPAKALGTGALLGAVGWGILDPLPPVPGR